jgi:threonylcarbamoyladenosine tRNA methylthiotransferase MtaB
MALPASPPTNRGLNKREMGSLTDSVALETLGCKLNQAESESLAKRFSDIGCRVVTPAESPTVYILNTCAVTHVADRKSRHLLRVARRRNPNAYIIAAGCYVNRAPEDLNRMPEVDLAICNKDKERLPQTLAKRNVVQRANATLSSGHRTRSFIKIQEGCDQSCTYCVVPHVRGMDLSRPANDVIGDISQRVDEGYKEIVLTGTCIGSYRPGLEPLLKRILSETGTQRLRLSSLQPQEITDDLLNLWQNDRLCRHLHIPLQSGSDRVLQRMGRRYSTTDYAKAVSQIREAIPDVAITTDIMVGFPGETDEEFAESHCFCQKMAFADIHVFQYSKRPETRAMSMPDQVGNLIKKERSERMIQLAMESSKHFREQFLRHDMPVLWEQETGSGMWSGLTDNYIRVVARSDDQLSNKFITARLAGSGEDYLTADLGR